MRLFFSATLFHWSHLAELQGFNRLMRLFFSATRLSCQQTTITVLFQSANAPLLLCDEMAARILEYFDEFQSANAPLLLCDITAVLSPDPKKVSFNRLMRLFFSATATATKVPYWQLAFQSANAPLLLCDTV